MSTPPSHRLSGRPGLRDHVPGHWQTLLQEELERRSIEVACVPRRSNDKLSLGLWVDALEQSLAQMTAPVILAAHSGGVMMVVHWAQSSSRPIHGALLAAPADLERPLPPGYPTRMRSRRRTVGCRYRENGCHFQAS